MKLRQAGLFQEQADRGDAGGSRGQAGRGVFASDAAQGQHGDGSDSEAGLLQCLKAGTRRDPGIDAVFAGESLLEYGTEEDQGGTLFLG